MNAQTDLPRLVRELRQRTGLTQEKFAAKLGVTYPTINRWENGRAKPSPLALKQIKDLARSLGKGGKDLFQNSFPKGRANMAKDSNNGANLGLESELWRAADALRGSMDAAEYKHVVIGLIFLNYISDAFEAQHARLEAERAQGADPEDPDEQRIYQRGDRLCGSHRATHGWAGPCGFFDRG